MYDVFIIHSFPHFLMIDDDGGLVVVSVLLCCLCVSFFYFFFVYNKMYNRWMGLYGGIDV
ncbi:hypothetical protein OAV88_04065 [bacterium]|nr:hypothetical protein [bacterium]